MLVKRPTLPPELPDPLGIVPATVRALSVQESSSMRSNVKKAWVAACGALAVLVTVAVTCLVVVQPAAATAQFAKDTGKSCGECHTNASGGGPLTAFGEKFKANGNKMPK
jgi:mono/diheme cytochrome c family protein